MTDVEILRKLIDLIPLIHKNRGISVSRLKELANFKSERELIRVIDGIKMFGTLPYLPGDLIDVYFDDDRVFIDFPQGLDRPFKLGSEEWALVWKVISDEISYHTDEGASSEILRKILDKIPTIPVLTNPEAGVNRRRSLIEQAMRDNRRVRFRYQRVGSTEILDRSVDPWIVFMNSGNTYLLGYCHLREALRIFHLSRMDNPEVLDTSRETRMDDSLRGVIEDSPIFHREREIVRGTLAFDPKVAGTIEEMVSVSGIKEFGSTDPRFEGWLMAEASVPDLPWFTAFIRSLGTQVLILSPDSLRRAFIEELEQIPLPG